MYDDYKPNENEKPNTSIILEEGKLTMHGELLKLANVIIDSEGSINQGVMLMFLSLFSEYVMKPQEPDVVHHKMYGSLVFKELTKQTNLTNILIILRIMERIIQDESFQSDEIDFGEYSQILFSFFTSDPQKPLDFHRTSMNKQMTEKIESRVISNIRLLVLHQEEAVGKEGSLAARALNAAATSIVRSDSAQVLFECRRLVEAVLGPSVPLEDAECLEPVFAMIEAYREQEEADELLRIAGSFCSCGEEFTRRFAEVVPIGELFRIADDNPRCIDSIFRIGSALLEWEEAGREFAESIDLEAVREMVGSPGPFGGCIKAVCRFFTGLVSRDAGYVERLSSSGVLEAAVTAQMEARFEDSVCVAEMIAAAVEGAERADFLGEQSVSNALMPLAGEDTDLYFRALSKIGYYCKRHGIEIELEEEIEKLIENEDNWPKDRIEDIKYFVEVFEEQTHCTEN